MCLLALCHRVAPEAPILLAANRDEHFDRPALPPAIQGGRPRVICGLDQRAGGTWLGVNEFGLVVTVTNRPRKDIPPAPPSRGALCRELLTCSSADEAARRAEAELSTGRYAGANYLCADARQAFVVHGGDRVERLAIEPGLALLGNGDLNDPTDRRLAQARLGGRSITRAADFIEQSRAVFSTPPVDESRNNLVLRAAGRGTVSSTLLAISATSGESVYLYAPGPPDQMSYADFSALLRENVARGVST